MLGAGASDEDVEKYIQSKAKEAAAAAEVTKFNNPQQSSTESCSLMQMNHCTSISDCRHDYYQKEWQLPLDSSQ